MSGPRAARALLVLAGALLILTRSLRHPGALRIPAGARRLGGRPDRLRRQRARPAHHRWRRGAVAQYDEETCGEGRPENVSEDVDAFGVTPLEVVDAGDDGASIGEVYEDAAERIHGTCAQNVGVFDGGPSGEDPAACDISLLFDRA